MKDAKTVIEIAETFAKIGKNCPKTFKIVKNGFTFFKFS